MNKLLAAVAVAYKAFTRMIFSAHPRTWWSASSASVRPVTASTLQDARGSSIIMAVALWLARTFPEAPIRVLAKQAGGELEPVPDHPMTALIRRPNAFYSGQLLWFSTLIDWLISGNAYWLKIRSGGNRVVELWWVPSTLIEPAWPDDGRTFISHYTYTPDVDQLVVQPQDVVHFRYGLDPLNTRKGLSPLGSLLREIYTDAEASSFTSTILRNLGVPGLVLSPRTDMAIPAADAQEYKDEVMQRFGGDRRGEAFVSTQPIEISVLGYNPEQMNLRSMRRIPEERVTAILGVPAIVVGLGAGLDRSTFANFSEAREAAYESNLLPTQRLLAEELHTQLLGDFADPSRFEIDFDLSNVRVLQEDQNDLHMRVREDLKAGLLTVNESLAMLGMEQRTDGDVLYVPSNLIPTRVDALIPELLAPVPTPPEEEEEEVEPEAAARRGSPEMKSAAQFSPAILRLRERLVRSSYLDIAQFLEAQAGRVTSTSLFEQKAESDAVFDAESEARALRAVLDPWYRRALESVSDLTQFALGISFEIDDPLTRAYLAQCGDLITNITRTTQQAIQQALVAGQAEGESYQTLARRIRGLPAFNQQRAMLVSRTELGASTNHATMLSFTRSGVVVGVEFTDGDEHEPCASINGRIMSLEEARSVPVLFHPRCTQSRSPVTDVRELPKARTNGHVKEAVLH